MNIDGCKHMWHGPGHSWTQAAELSLRFQGGVVVNQFQRQAPIMLDDSNGVVGIKLVRITGALDCAFEVLGYVVKLAWGLQNGPAFFFSSCMSDCDVVFSRVRELQSLPSKSTFLQCSGDDFRGQLGDMPLFCISLNLYDFAVP